MIKTYYLSFTIGRNDRYTYDFQEHEGSILNQSKQSVGRYIFTLHNKFNQGQIEFIFFTKEDASNPKNIHIPLDLSKTVIKNFESNYLTEGSSYRLTIEDEEGNKDQVRFIGI